MMKSKKMIPFVSIVILFLITIGGFHMYQKKYQMAVLATGDSENDVEWPSKKKWVDASSWLKTSQYIKIDDFHLINIKYVPIQKVNDFRITRAIHRSIQDSINSMPSLLPLSRMNDDTFYSFMEGNISYEYLRTEFNSETLTPISDYFLFSFTYKEGKYEVELLREPYENGFSFPYSSFIHKSGYWHSTSPAGYSYRDYLAGKPVK